MRYRILKAKIRQMLSRQVRVSAATTEVGEDGFDDFGRRIGIRNYAVQHFHYLLVRHIENNFCIF